ncbi:OCIA domain-containing protein 1 isoform X2 [Carcharodon carcharias]|uniref:OCIA domain-containing protein 1 isoform X2 n=1 Tax=Carcharodon carcharias TaxID=13397 RepID=UPI001B7E0260|nr:OCIA domain-containing protein 1 isoform X2 [Carcharodon carcharias]
MLGVKVIGLEGAVKVPLWFNDNTCTSVENQGPVGASYIPTEEERRVFRECNQESFYYRSLPFSGMSMLVTQVLISRGILSTSTRFGSIPKVVFAGVCGYLVGKISYMKTCQEKFMRLENSPLGDALRQGRRTFLHQHSYQKSEFSDSTAEHLQPEVNSPTTYSDDHNYSDHSEPNYESVPFSSTLSESAPTGIDDTPGAPGPEIEESKPQRKSMTYDELRNKNRELYEVTVAQKAESLHKPTPQRLPNNKGAKINKYGDTWEE